MNSVSTQPSTFISILFSRHRLQKHRAGPNFYTSLGSPLTTMPAFRGLVAHRTQARSMKSYWRAKRLAKPTWTCLTIWARSTPNSAASTTCPSALATASRGICSLSLTASVLYFIAAFGGWTILPSGLPAFSTSTLPLAWSVVWHSHGGQVSGVIATRKQFQKHLNRLHQTVCETSWGLSCVVVRYSISYGDSFASIVAVRIELASAEIRTWNGPHSRGSQRSQPHHPTYCFFGATTLGVTDRRSVPGLKQWGPATRTLGTMKPPTILNYIYDGSSGEHTRPSCAPIHCRIHMSSAEPGAMACPPVGICGMHLCGEPDWCPPCTPPIMLSRLPQ